MPSHHPRSDAADLHGGDDRDGDDRDGGDAHGRRAFLRRTAGATGGVVGVGGVAVGDARGQETATGSAAPGEEGTITTKGALPADAPTFEHSDYVGFFVGIRGVNQNASTRDVSSCPFVQRDDAAVAYEATLIDQLGRETGRTDTLLFAEVNNNTIEHGKVFVVNGQQSCGSGHVQVQLEEVSGANVPAGTETTRTDTALPGFGVGAALAGLLGGAALRRRRE